MLPEEDLLGGDFLTLAVYVLLLKHLSTMPTRLHIVDGSTKLRRCSIREQMGSWADWRGGVGGSRGTTNGV